MIPIRGLRAPVRITPAEPVQHSSAARMGDARCRWTADMDVELTRLWQAGQTSYTIAETLRVSRCAVMGRCRRLGLNRKAEKAAATPQQESATQRAGKIFAVLKQTAERGEECPENRILAERFGCGASTISAAFNFLEANGMIVVERANAKRVVTIRATGQRTAGEVRKLHYTAQSRAA